VYTSARRVQRDARPGREPVRKGKIPVKTCACGDNGQEVGKHHTQRLFIRALPVLSSRGPLSSKNIGFFPPTLNEISEASTLEAYAPLRLFVSSIVDRLLHAFVDNVMRMTLSCTLYITNWKDLITPGSLTGFAPDHKKLGIMTVV